jgi:hypothetical protein
VIARAVDLASSAAADVAATASVPGLS